MSKLFCFLIIGCDITAKAEHLNPGGSVKDRAALYLIKEAEEKGAYLIRCFNIEWFSLECRTIKTKVITLTNHNRHH